MLSAGSCAGVSDLFEPRDLPAAVSGLLAPAAQPFAVAMSDAEAGPLAGTASPGGFTPTQIRHAYGFDQVFFNGGTIAGDGAGQTIAIVNAYHASTAAFDLAAFNSAFGLPAPPSFTQVSQTGSTTVFPPTNSGWALESALDVQWAHALAPAANILLVEANSAGFGDLTTAVEYARSRPGVSVVSMSWGAEDFAGETIYDSSFLTPTNHAGVVFAAAAGNSGSPGAYPAFSPNTLAVGGTTLALNGSNNISSETAWSKVGTSGSGGGGISQYEAQPSFQTDSGLVTQSSTHRASPDVAFDANPNTGVPVYDSFNNGTSTPWTKVGGTSFATPSWAALVAIADQGRNLAGLPVLDGPDLMTRLYSMPASYFNDITSGTTGGATPQTATIGYDLATGRGSPKVNLIVPALVGTASIGGAVFDDANSNGTLDGEAGLAGWTVYSDLNNNSALDPIVVNTVNSTDVSKAIPNNTTITSNNIVSGLSGNIIDVNVTVNISHNNDSNLVLTLISPDNTRIELASQVGGSGNDFTNTVFDDSAAVAISRGTSPFAGSYHPAEPFSVVYGTNPNGTWKLEISDTTAPTSGTLNSWSLQFTTGDPSTTSAANGTYTLVNLQPGMHRVREVVQSPYIQTAPAGGFYSINAAAGANVTAQNFGNWNPPSTSPSGVSLLAASDTGISNSDRITKLNNSSPDSALEFQVAGTIAGATVTVFADGNAIGSATASGTTTTVITDGATPLGDGSRAITARQTEPGKPISASSPTLAITVDTVSPVSSIVPVLPNPHAGPVGEMTINFNEPVSGLNLNHLELTRDGGADLLTGAQTVSTNDGLEWTLADLTSITGIGGFYEFNLSSAGSPISDVAGNLYTLSDGASFTVIAGILGRYLFYNQSGTAGPTVRYDGNDPAINSLDDNAIASDKAAYLPGTGAATFANISSYSKGINGIMIDIAGPHGTISADDFIFLVGNNNVPSSWATAPDPISVSVRAGAGTSGSDRVEIIWNNGDIKKQWLEVITLANANTGLEQQAGYPTGQADVFFFGNALANSGFGDTATLSTVDTTDELQARNNPATLFTNIPITNVRDYNRDAIVDTTDQLLARNNTTNPLTVTRYLSIGSPPAAPQGAPMAAPGGGPTAAPSATPAAAPMASSSGNPLTSRVAVSTSTDVNLVDRSLSQLTFSLAAASSERPHRGQASMPLEWLSFLDEQLLEILAVGRMRFASRRR